MRFDPTAAILMHFILPLWLAAGVADWLCHKATHIEIDIAWKSETLSPLYVALLLGAAGVVFLLFSEEIFCGLRARRRFELAAPKAER